MNTNQFWKTVQDWVTNTGIKIVIAIIILIVSLGIINAISKKIAKKADSLRNSMICYGAFIYLLMHLLVNFMGILALVPLTGVPVPFLSYGGSFNMNVIIMMFIVLRVSIETETNE